MEKIGFTNESSITYGHERNDQTKYITLRIINEGKYIISVFKVEKKKANK